MRFQVLVVMSMEMAVFHHVAWQIMTDVSEVLIASLIRAISNPP
jgi:hypothetical protein